MELINLSCNKCGAPLEAASNANYLTCGYCRSRLAVHKGTSAYFTEVLDQIEINTSEIRKGMDTLVDYTTNVQWETREIVWGRGSLGLFKRGNWWIAVAIGINGRYESARSDMFRESTERRENQIYPRKTSESLTAGSRFVDSPSTCKFRTTAS